MTTAAGEGGSPRRIHIVGGPGSGKTVLATRLGRLVGVPVTHLDEVARVGGGTGPVRSIDDRLRDVAGVASRPAWVSEGVHLGWTDALLERADLIVWLDHVRPSVASRRIIGRFIRNALTEMRRRRGRERFLRLRDYACHLRDLMSGVRETRDYQERETQAAGGPTRSETEYLLMRLAHEGHEVVHCRTEEDIERLLERLYRTGS